MQLSRIMGGRRRVWLAVVAGTVVSIWLLAVVHGQTPPLPHLFYGTVTVGGQPAQIGTVITAKVNDVIQGSITTTQTGLYGTSTAEGDKLTVSDSSTIEFYISNVRRTRPLRLSVASLQSSR